MAHCFELDEGLCAATCRGIDFSSLRMGEKLGPDNVHTVGTSQKDMFAEATHWAGFAVPVSTYLRNSPCAGRRILRQSFSERCAQVPGHIYVASRYCVYPVRGELVETPPSVIRASSI